MLRRYLIVNGVSTLLMYAAIWAIVPAPSSLLSAARQTVETFANETSLFGPIVPYVSMLIGN